MATFYPKFLSKNQITTTADISDSAGTATGNRVKLIDRNPDYQYMSIGSTSGTRTITWTPSLSTPRTISRIFVQNINWDTFTIKYNTTSLFSTAISVVGNTKTSMYFEFNSVAITNVVISVFTTMTAGDVIRCGQFYAGTQLYEIANTVGGQFLISPFQKSNILTLSDGTTYKTTDRLHIRNVDFDLYAVPEAEKLNFKAVYEYNAISPFVFIPYPATASDTWDGKADHYNWINGFDFENYTDDVDVNGYNGVINIAQAGGLG